MSTPRNESRAADDCLAGGGEMGSLMRAFDWSRTPLGPVEAWPQSLKTAVRIMLTSRYAMWMAWGPELTFFCNDAYRPTLGVKHAWALGSRADRVWEEIWPDIGPRIETVLKTGMSTWDERLLLFLERSGYPEETYHTFSYSPLSDDGGGDRRHALRRHRGYRTGHRRAAARRRSATWGPRPRRRRPPKRPVASRSACWPRTRRTSRSPCSTCEARTVAAATLRGSSQLAEGGAASPDTIDLTDDEAPGWPLAEADQDGPPRPRARREGTVRRPPRRAVEAPAEPGDGPPPPRVGGPRRGALVVGVSPCRAFDEGYRRFFELAVRQIATAIGNARAYEEEKRRAEALAELDRAKTAFFSNVSHEFRTPLTLMLGPVEDMLAEARRRDLPEDRELLAVVHRNALRLQKLVNTLLDFSRIEAGRVQASYEPTDLAAPHRRPRERLPLRRREGRDAAHRRLRAARRAGLRGPGHVGEGRPEPRLERLQVHARRGDRGRARDRKATPRRSASGTRAAASPRTSSRTSSSGSIASRGHGPGRRRAPASGSPWSRSW